MATDTNDSSTGRARSAGDRIVASARAFRWTARRAAMAAPIALAGGLAALGLATLLALFAWQGWLPVALVATPVLLPAAAALIAVRRRGSRPARPAPAGLGASETAAAVAHDLRSPLVTVHSYLELLTEDAFGPLPPEARQAAERAALAAGHAQSLVEEALRAYALDAAGAPELGETPAEAADLRGVLDDVVASLEFELAATHATLEVGDMPRVYADGAALYRVFVNLLQNALKYGAPGRAPRIVVSASVAQGRCEVAVRDWGVGIVPEQRDRAFEAGVRGDGVEALPGAGLGLATVRSLVAAQNGRVWIDPAVTDGTCIRVSLRAA